MIKDLLAIIITTRSALNRVRDIGSLSGPTVLVFRSQDFLRLNVAKTS